MSVGWLGTQLPLHRDSASLSAKACLSHTFTGELPKSTVQSTFSFKKSHFQRTRSKAVPAQIPEHPYGEVLGLLRKRETIC